ncbi:MAG: ATPase [Flavobacteriia bacterium]|nr:ATPase [Flavobacteriia bacterium]OJX36238.1 MAG: ATPase [Flavobacteriia bacterium 40-80]
MEQKHFEIKENQIIYDFMLTMKYLSDFGQKRFGSDFRILRVNTTILKKLMAYAIRDEEYCKKYDIDPDKGILLVGTIGCGKTSLMQLFNILTHQHRKYTVKPTRTIAGEFLQNGYDTIHKYGNSDTIYCFDDLGIEQNMKHFGNESNVMAEILLSRYDLLRSRGTITHATTNLNANELEKLYGNRVRSRLREMFNLITFPDNAEDLR